MENVGVKTVCVACGCVVVASLSVIGFGLLITLKPLVCVKQAHS